MKLRAAVASVSLKLKCFIGSHRAFNLRSGACGLFPGFYEMFTTLGAGLGPQVTQAQTQCVRADCGEVLLNAPSPSSATASGLGATSQSSWAEHRSLSPSVIRSLPVSVFPALSLFVSFSFALPRSRLSS